MKKTLSLLLCIILISCLVSCDLSVIWNSIKGTTGSTTTTTTEPPVYETVTLGELINKEDVAYIKHGYTYFLSSSINYLSTTTDIDMFFDFIEGLAPYYKKASSERTAKYKNKSSKQS